MSPDQNDAPTDVLNQRRLTRAESARINGRKSRGPKTAAGKARSSRNLLHHGLMAKRLAPLLSASGERADYETHLKGLINNLLVNIMPQSGMEIKQTFADLRFEIAALEAAIESLEQDDRLALTREQCIVVRGVITGQLVTWEGEQGQTLSGVAMPNSLAVYKQVNPTALKLPDPVHVLDTLCGKFDLLDAEVGRWMVLLRHLKTQATSRLKETFAADQAHERACRSLVVEELHELPFLHRLMEMEEVGRRALERNIDLLMKLRRQRKSSDAD